MGPVAVGIAIAAALIGIDCASRSKGVEVGAERSTSPQNSVETIPSNDSCITIPPGTDYLALLQESKVANANVTKDSFVKWLIENPEGKKCRGRIAIGSSYKGVQKYMVPLVHRNIELCAGGKGYRTTVEASSYLYACLNTPCRNYSIEVVDDDIKACIPPK